MTSTEHTDTLQQAVVRLDQLIWLPNEMAHFDARSETFREFCDEFTEQDTALLAVIPCLKPFADVGADTEEVAEVLFEANVRAGFLFKAAHPVMEWSSERSSSYSWGRYNTAWLYAADLDGAVTVAVEWAKSLDRAAQAEQLAR